MSIISDFLGTGDKVSTQTSSIPPYLEAFYRDQIMPRLQGMIDRPPPVYGGPRNAALSTGEQSAINTINANAASNPWGGYLDDARAMVGRGADPYSATSYNAALVGPEGNYDPALIGQTERLGQADIDRYMSPYKSQVIDATIDKINAAGDRAALRDRGRATRTGNLYSAGHGIVDAERDRNIGEKIASTTGSLLDQGFGQAVSQFNVDANRQTQGTLADVAAKNRAIEFLMSQGLTREQANQAALNQQRGSAATSFNRQEEFNRGQAMQGASALRDIGNQGFTQQRQSLQDQIGAGALTRGIEQQNLDTAYGDWREQRDWPLSNISNISQVAAGQPYARTTTTTTPGQSGLSAGLGAALIGSSLMPKSWGLADGGRVPRIDGPRGPNVNSKRHSSPTPGRQFGALPPPMEARRLSRDTYAA